MQADKRRGEGVLGRRKPVHAKRPGQEEYSLFLALEVVWNHWNIKYKRQVARWEAGLAG